MTAAWYSYNNGSRTRSACYKNFTAISKPKIKPKTSTRSECKMLNDESMILKTGNYNFEEGFNFVAQEVLISRILHWKSLLVM